MLPGLAYLQTANKFMDPTTFKLLFACDLFIPPVEIAFTASNYYPAYNTATQLSWQTTNAASVSINQGIGNVAASGNTSVTGGHNAFRTYTLTAIGQDGLSYTSSLNIQWGASNCPQQWVDYGWC